MSMKHSQQIVLLVAITCGGAPLVEAQATATRLTLDEAVAHGLANSYRIAELQARRVAAEAAGQGRAAARLPTLSLLGGYTRTNHVDEFVIVQPGQPPRVLYPDIPDNSRARLDLQWPIFTAGRTDALERAARAEWEAAGEDLAAARADLRLEVTRAFWALVTAREAAQVLARSVDRAAAHVRDLRSRLEQGLIPPNEVLTAEAQHSRERLLALEAAYARDLADADLRRLLGLEAAPAIELEAVLERPAVPVAGADTLIETARAQRPERRALADRAKAARARSAAAASAVRPQVGVNAGYEYARPNPRIFPRIDRWHDSWDVSVNVAWALWDGGRARADHAEAAALARAVEARIGEFDRQLAYEIRQRWLELDSSLAAVPVAADGLRAALEARRVVGERFAVGVATSTEVLDAQTDLLQAELARTRALAQARLAEARLDRAVGW